MIDAINNAHDASVKRLELIDGQIDNLSLNDKTNLLRLACSKIAHGGIICVSAIDAYEVIRGFYKGYLNLEEFNKMLRPSLCAADNICDVLESSGLEIKIVRVNNYRYYVEAYRS